MILHSFGGDASVVFGNHRFNAEIKRWENSTRYVGDEGNPQREDRINITLEIKRGENTEYLREVNSFPHELSIIISTMPNIGRRDWKLVSYIEMKNIILLEVTFTQMEKIHSYGVSHD